MLLQFLNEQQENVLGLQDTIYSNRICLTKEPTMFFPSAFTPSNGDIKKQHMETLIVGLESISSFQFTDIQ